MKSRALRVLTLSLMFVSSVAFAAANVASAETRATILCSSADTDPACHTLDTLPNNVMAREYQLALPTVKKLEAELSATRKRLDLVRRRA